MSKMSEDDLLSRLKDLEDEAAAYTHGHLSQERKKSIREYYRLPYGNETEGLSGIVTSEVFDTVEWMLPDLLDVFVSTDRAVTFEPSRESEVAGADQATDVCNYVFYKQNNGFLVLYTAFKDALLSSNCAVMWRKEDKRVKSVITVSGATQEMLAIALQDAGEDAAIEQATPLPPQPVIDPATGQPALDAFGQPVIGEQLYNARISRTESRATIKVEAFQPQDLYVQRDWTSPLLADCPYVARIMRVSLSELREMGHKVDDDDLRASRPNNSLDYIERLNGDNTRQDQTSSGADDESQTMGYLRIEYVLVDFDGDGIAERRCIHRLEDKILKNEEVSHVPIATASPVLIQHQWDGMSIAECVSDVQLFSTELTRQMIDSGRLALNPRTKVLTDPQGAPYANLDDLLDSRAGGLVRQTRPDATAEMLTPWVGGQMFPMFEYKDRMLEKRTGVSANSQGLDPNSLNRGGAYETKVMNAAKMRVKMIARIFAEILVKPMFLGILKTLTDGGMEKIAFRLRDEFVEYDPNEWRDQYDMTVNVGLGTGDKDKQAAALTAIAQTQAVIAQSPFAPLLIRPKNIYNTQARIVEAAGFKNVGDFYVDPGDGPAPPPPPPNPDPIVQVAQIKLQGEAQRFQAETQLSQQIEQLKAAAKLQELQASLELQAANDARDAERESMVAAHKQQMEAAKIELDRYKVDADNRTKILVAQIAHPGEEPPSIGLDDTGAIVEKPNPAEMMAQAVAMLADQMSRPKQIVRDENGRVVGVQ